MNPYTIALGITIVICTKEYKQEHWPEWKTPFYAMFKFGWYFIGFLCIGLGVSG